MSAQLEMPGMPRRLFPATPSKLASFGDCPRRYRFTYVDRPDAAEGAAVGAQQRRLRGARGAAVVVGAAGRAAHRAGRPPAAVRPAGRPTGFRDAEQSERWRARAAGWLTDYVDGLDPADEPVGTERTGRRHHRAPGAVRAGSTGSTSAATSWWSSTTRPAAPSAPTTRPAAHRRWPPTCSASGARCAAPARRVELHHLPTGTVAAFEHTDRSLANHVRRAEDVAADITAATEALAAGADRDEAFPRRPGPAVRLVRLPAQLPDRPGRGPARETWSFLAEDEPALTARVLGARAVGRTRGRHAGPARSGERRARCGSASVACRKARSAAVAAASVSPRPGSRYSRRAQRGRVATASPARLPHAGRAGVSSRTHVGIGGRTTSFQASRAAGRDRERAAASARSTPTARPPSRGTSSSVAPTSTAAVTCSATYRSASASVSGTPARRATVSSESTSQQCTHSSRSGSSTR